MVKKKIFLYSPIDYRIRKHYLDDQTFIQTVCLYRILHGISTEHKNKLSCYNINLCNIAQLIVIVQSYCNTIIMYTDKCILSNGTKNMKQNEQTDHRAVEM